VPTASPLRQVYLLLERWLCPAYQATPVALRLLYKSLDTCSHGLVTRTKICSHSNCLEYILLAHAFFAWLIHSICSSFVHRAGIFAALQDKNTGHRRMAPDL
jgi:hypothetical protein